MFSLSLNFPKFAAAGAIIALIVSGSPARADEMAQNLGPVGPHEPNPSPMSLGQSSAAKPQNPTDATCVRQMPQYRPNPHARPAYRCF